MTEKYAKGPGTWQKQSQQPSAHAAMASIRPAVAFHKQLFVQPSGIKELAFHAITATLICTAQTAFILFPLSERLFAVFLIVPVGLGDYLCERTDRVRVMLNVVKDLKQKGL